MNSNANEKFNVAGDRPLGAAKPVDPATRLSELLAQSLEELTRPFDPPRVDPLMRPQPTPQPPRLVSVAPVPAPPPPPAAAPEPAHPEPDIPIASPSRLDDKALAELEAELFAAAGTKPVRDPPAPLPAPAPTPVAEVAATPPAPEKPAAEEVPAAPEAKRDAPVIDPFLDRVEQASPAEVTTPVPADEAKTAPTPPPSDADAARLIARVRRMMILSLAVTFIAVGSVAGFIGYRVFKGEGSSAKTADKLPDAPAPTSEMTISIPRGARILQSAVAEDRLIVTIDVGGRTEVRTYDLKTLQPAGRLTFSTTP